MFDSLRGLEYINCALFAGCKRVSKFFIILPIMQRKDNSCFRAKGNHGLSLICHGSNEAATELPNQIELKQIRALKL